MKRKQATASDKIESAELHYQPLVEEESKKV
jgi:hypothetical protein